VVFGLGLLFAWIYMPVLSRYRDLKFEEDDMVEKIEALDQHIEALSEEKKLLEEDKEYLEKVVRDELGMVKPGEIVYKFIKDPIDTF